MLDLGSIDLEVTDAYRVSLGLRVGLGRPRRAYLEPEQARALADELRRLADAAERLERGAPAE